MSKKRRSFSAEFKAQAGLETLKGIEPIHVIAQRHEVHPVQVSQAEDGGDGAIAAGVR